MADGRYAMGTACELTLVAADRREGARQLDVLFDRVEAIEAEISTWRPESAASRLNARAGTPPEPVPAALADVLTESLRLWRESGGAFDVTVGPLLQLWRLAEQRGRLPSAVELARARARVGSAHLVVREGRAGLALRGMSIDLGGIGKGFALDRLAEMLRERGDPPALLSFGQSSILASGSPPGEDAWRIALAGPEGMLGTVELRDAALSVSSSLGQYREIGGTRYGHVVDPRTGEASTHGRLAVVAAPSATVAEAWSTALLVLGPEGLGRLREQAGVEALVVEESGERSVTPGFVAATGLRPLGPS